jgi:hypothetical protein
VPLREDDTCIDDIRIPAHTSVHVVIQKFRVGMPCERATNQSMYITQRSCMAADVSGVAEWSIWCEWSIFVGAFRIWSGVSGAVSLTRLRQVCPLDAVIMTQQTAFSQFMLDGKRLTVKGAEKIASEVMEHAMRRNLKCKWGKCGIHYGTIHLLKCVSDLKKTSCASAHWRLAAYQPRTYSQDSWSAARAHKDWNRM